MKEKERNIVESVTNNLIKLETIDKLLKELKLCSSKEKFVEFILKFSEKVPLVSNVEDFDILTGYKWHRFKSYIQMNLLILKERE